MVRGKLMVSAEERKARVEVVNAVEMLVGSNEIGSCRKRELKTTG